MYKHKRVSYSDSVSRFKLSFCWLMHIGTVEKKRISFKVLVHNIFFPPRHTTKPNPPQKKNDIVPTQIN